MRVFSTAYFVTLGLTIGVTTVVTAAARSWPGRWVLVADWALAAVLLATSVLWLDTTISAEHFSAATSLPLPLCDLAALVTVAALLTRWSVLAELTYFWGLAGTIQSLVTPDLNRSFPSPVFFEYVIAHGAIVCAASLLVIGQRIAPRRHAVVRVFAITVAYTAVVAIADAVTGGNYMYLRQPPGSWSLLKVLGPWPWYIGSAALVAILLFTLLDLPFEHARRAGKHPRRPSVSRAGT